MNIAYYSHYFTPEIGAPSARIYDLARQWIESDNQVQVVTCFPNHPTGRLYPGYQHRCYLHENLEGIEVHRHWTYVTPNKGFVRKTLGHFSYLPAANFISGRHLRSPDVTIGTSPTLFAAMAAAGLAKRRKIPFIMEVRDLWPAIFVELGIIRNRWLIRWLERWEMGLYERAAKVVVVTEAFRRKLIERGLPRDKVFTIPNGADINFWSSKTCASQMRRRLNLDGRFVVLYIGAHGISHALERILDSAHELQDFPEIHFLFVGEGAEKEKLVQRSKELRLSNTTFADSVGKNEVREFYAMADVCLVPLKDIPLFETFIPSKMFEMMAMGRPIVGSLRGEAADILRRSGSALVVEPENSHELAQAVLRLFHLEDQTRQEMGQLGREFVTAHYSRRALAASYVDVMKEAVAEYRSR
jgi:glycosyltransferase involved in cell wall biosynthesis